MATLFLILCSILFYVTPYLNFELFYLSWFFFIPILYLIENNRINLIKLGLYFGIGSNLIATYWVSSTISNLTGSNWITSSLLHLAYSTYESIFFILVFVLTSILIKKISSLYGRYLCIIFLYILIEQSFPRIFPYKLGNTQILFNEMAQLISIFGINMISILVLIFNIGLYEILFKRKIKAFYVVISIFMLAFSAGKFLHKSFDSNLDKNNNINIVVVQPVESLKDIKQIQKDIDIKKYNYDITIWPESSLSRVQLKNKEDYIKFKETFSENFTFSSNILMLGTITQNKVGYFNSALLINKNNEIIDVYSKNRLMIFGEYYPMQNIISKIIPIYNEFISLKKGEIKLMKGGENLNIGAIICYEDLFEDNAIKLTQLNSQILINLTNGKWYGDSLATYQHLMLSIPRAIENRRFLIRSTYNGISAIISPTGEIINKISLNEKGYIDSEVTLINKKSFYSKYKSKILLTYHIIFVLLLFLFLKKFRNE